MGFFGCALNFSLCMFNYVVKFDFEKEIEAKFSWTLLVAMGMGLLWL